MSRKWSKRGAKALVGLSEGRFEGREAHLRVNQACFEEVWNKFLLSPLEMAEYIDEFHSPWVKSWFDVGNVVFYGYPQEWIHTLGKRIAKIHLKDFKVAHSCYEWVDLGDGEVMWPAVRQALIDIGYSGSAICELRGGDEAYLRDLSHRIDRLLIQA